MFGFTGVVEEIGEGVTQFAGGDAVYGYTDARRDGAQAEYCLALPSELALKPSSLDHIQAAAVPLSALTAWQAFFDHAQLIAGQPVLIHGAAGGVGIFAVQLAHWIGAHVIGTASARHHELLRALGTTEVIDYTATRFEKVVHDIDLVLDTRSGTTLERSWKILKPSGALISLVKRPSQERAQQLGIRAIAFIVKPDGTQLARLSELIERGVLHPIIERIFPLLEARNAYQQVLGGHTQGKLVLRVISQEEGPASHITNESTERQRTIHAPDEMYRKRKAFASSRRSSLSLSILRTFRLVSLTQNCPYNSFVLCEVYIGSYATSMILK
jgi:NADPH:quinone reductase-like Zn-dependent oxidoreductase